MRGLTKVYGRGEVEVYGLRGVVLEALARVNEEFGTTTAVFTRNVVIGEMADRVVRLSDGQIASVERNAHRRTARELSW